MAQGPMFPVGALRVKLSTCSMLCLCAVIKKKYCFIKSQCAAAMTPVNAACLCRVVSQWNGTLCFLLYFFFPWDLCLCRKKQLVVSTWPPHDPLHQEDWGRHLGDKCLATFIGSMSILPLVQRGCNKQYAMLTSLPLHWSFWNVICN